MFDDPKKELERLQAQLLAAEEQEDDFLSDDDSLTDETLQRSAGFSAQPYVMDSGRYVAAPKKRRTGLVILALIPTIAVIVLVILALGEVL